MVVPGTLRQFRGIQYVVRHPMLFLAAALFAIHILLFWPGIVEPDALAVYGHAQTNVFDDWHPPILGRLWQLFLAVGLEGTAPFFVLQAGLFWLGLGLIADGLSSNGFVRSAICILAIGCVPHVLGWNNLILKDTQMTSCLIAAAGIYANRHLNRRGLSNFQIGLIGLLLVYATLVRHNAIFAVVPLVIGMTYNASASWRQYKMAMASAFFVGTFAISGWINQDLFRAEHAYAENSLKLFDLAGVGHYAQLETIPGITPEKWALAEKRNCYWPSLWDSYNTPESDGGCPWIYDALATEDLTKPWLDTVLHHAPAYFHHRLAHYNESMRIWTSRYNWDASSPRETDNPNPYNIGRGNKAIYASLANLQMLFDYTPLGRPFAWYAFGLLLLIYGWKLPRSPQRQMALVLLASAGILGSSYFFISVANEFRYHHWSIVAIGCSACLLFSINRPNRIRTAVAMVAPICAVFGLVFFGHMIRYNEWEPIAASSWIDPPTP